MADQQSSTSSGATDTGSDSDRQREGALAQIDGTAGADTLQGTNDGDTISGMAGNDSVLGGAGNDTLIGGDGSDFIDGEAGIDLANYSVDGGAVVVNLSLGTATDGFGATDTLSSIENILGSPFADTLTGNLDDNVITAGTGNDTLDGRAGNDTLDGGDNADTVVYSQAPGGAVINLTTGTASDGFGWTDTLISIENAIGSDSADDITGTDNNNQLFGGGGNDEILGLDGPDLIEGQGGNDTVDGGAGDDQVEGGAGADIVLGGDGDDSLIGGAGADTIDGGDGIDTLFLEIDGETGADATRFTVVDLSTGVVSSDGIETVTGGITQEDNTGTGGTRTDFADDITTDVKITGGFIGTLEDTGDPNTGDEDFVQIDLVANTRYTIRLGGTFIEDPETGEIPFHTLLAPDGTFLAQSSLPGGVGEPAAEITFIPEVSGTYFIAIRNPTKTTSDGNYAITVTSSSVDTVSNIENVVGSDQDDNITGTNDTNTLTGEDGADTLTGLAGADTLDGGSGGDRLFGNSGNDVLIGGPGRDLLHGGDGVDTIDYSAETTRLQLDLALGTARTTADNVDTIVGVEIITGTNLGDSMSGNADANVFSSLDGDDVISGFGGQDTLSGGLGNDAIDGGSGNDTIDGGDGNDTLTGGDGDDTITGGLGDDTVDGGGGRDLLIYTGEWGSDTVIASEAGTIVSLTDANGLDVNAAPSGNDVTISIGGKTSSITLRDFVGNEGNFIVRDQSGDVLNINGSGTTVASALVIGSDDSLTARVGQGANNEDFYKFVAPTDGQFTVSISGADPGTVVSFLNFAGGPLASATADSNGNATVSFDATRSETYLASIAASADTAYALNVSFDAQNTDDSLTNPVNVDVPFFLTSLTLDAATNPSDFYRVVAPENTTLVVNTSLVTGDFDIRIYDSLGNLLKESAQTGAVAEGLTLGVTSGEAYIVEIVARDATVTGNVQFTVEDQDDSGSNGSIDTAQSITLNADLSGGVGIDPNFADYYTFTLTTAGQLTISLSDLQDDLRIDLFDADGVRVGQAQTAGTANELLVQDLGAGTYFIGIVATNTLASSPYNLSVSFATPDAADSLSTATTFGGLPLDVTQTVGEGSDSADYYTFTPTEDGTVSANISGLTANIGVQGFDGNGVALDEAALGNMLDKSIAFPVVGGQQYFVGAVPTSEGANGTYRLQAEFNADAGNDLTAPSNVDPNFARTEAIGFNGDTDDNFRIISSDAGTLVVNVSNVSAPVDLHLYTADGTRLTSSTNGGNADEQITFDLEANTAYVIAVTPTSSSAQGFYDINSSFSVSQNAQAAAQVNVVDEDQVGS